MKLRIGLPLMGGSAWHGGVTYLDAIVRAFRALPPNEQPELWLIAGMSGDSDLSMHLDLIRLIDGVIGFNIDAEPTERLQCRSVHITDFRQMARTIDFIFPLNCEVLPGFASGSWIPDLQHKYLPHFFSEADIQARDEAVDFVAEAADTIIVSSRSVEQDFRRHYPRFKGQLVVVPFYSSFDDAVFAADAGAIAQKYGLPESYIICCNQFWQHKSHDQLFRGLAKTKSSIHLVCTGGQSDYRNTQWFPFLRGLIDELGIGARVTILGLLPRGDQVQLIRQSIGVIQPSLFEGWSTVLEDARGLGKPVLASNITVHLEQSVPGAAYFAPASVDEIAAQIDRLCVCGVIGPEASSEEKASMEVVGMQQAAARRLIRVANDAVIEHQRRSNNPQLEKQMSIEMQMTRRLAFVRSEFMKKQRVIESQETVIADQQHQLRELKNIVEGGGLLFQVIRPVIRVVNLFRPRIGNLHQYVPRPLTTIAVKPVDPLRSFLKISIVTPSFNQGKYIERTLLSVTDQAYPNLEYFVQDGGSKDNTVVLLKKHALNLSGWVSEADSGQSQAINRGLANTDGEIMAWLNSDDLLLPGALHIVADYFNDHPDVDVVYGNRLLIDENDMEIGRWILPGHDSNVLSWADYVPQETLFWRRRIWQKVGGKIDESFSFAMDWDLLVRFRDVGAKFGHIPQFLGAFRIHEQQKTSAGINEIGLQEMNRVRERIMGRVPTRKEIRWAVLPYLVKHIFVDIVYRVKTRLEGRANHKSCGAK